MIKNLKLMKKINLEFLLIQSKFLTQKTLTIKVFLHFVIIEKKDKCPPWSIQATEMLHNKQNKTIYYDKAVIKFYDFPIFYWPKLSHPDPSVDRRSGFLPPIFGNSKNLGSAVEIPYFWALDKEKDLTFKNKFFVSENPLLMAEYRHAFRKFKSCCRFWSYKGL